MTFIALQNDNPHFTDTGQMVYFVLKLRYYAYPSYIYNS